MLGIVAEAGALALTYFREGAKIWQKDGHAGPVTEADLAVDALLRERLLALLPGAAWLSEESEDDPARLDAARLWIVDPIDGTRAFVRDEPYFAISVALVEDGATVLGAVFAPALGEMFEARAGHGARLNGTAIHVGAKADIAGIRLIAYRDLIESRRWRTPWPEVETAMFNSIAYRLALVAAGRYDACLTLSPKSDWDLAAADLILKEAGGIATARAAAPFLYNLPEIRHPNVIAANPALHKALIDKLEDFGFRE